MRKSKILLWLVIVFGFVNLLDIITAMFILDGEANPIYLLTGSIFLIWVLKFAFVGLCIYIYLKNTYPSRWWLFSFIYTVTIGIIVISIGVVSNVYGIINPQIVVEASTISTGEKISYYATLIGVLMVFPYTIAVIVFKMFEKIENRVRYERPKKNLLKRLIRWD